MNKPKIYIVRSVVLLFTLLLCVPLSAQQFSLPEDELARETVLPVFPKRQIVLNRTIENKNRLEFGVGGGLEMNEPFYSDLMFNVQGTFNYSDTSAINVQALIWSDGLSQYGEQLARGNPGAGPTNFNPFDASLAPHPKWGLFANYQFIAYYGKISISKKVVMNLNTFALAGLGYINMDTENTVGLNLGLGQNFFFTKNMGLRFDLRWLIFQGPDATSANLDPTSNDPSAQPPYNFEDRIFYNSQISATLIFIL